MAASPDTLFFIHIPKTAGTSFREAAINRWGSRKVWSDYGPSRHSSPAVRSLVHEQQDYFAFQQEMQKKRIRMLSGHAPVRCYRRIFPAASLVTFLRNPIDRTISHYYTACSKQGFSGNFAAFCNIPEHQNVQSRYLEQMPIDAVRFVGLTEQYAEGIEIFNKSFSEKLKVLSLNQYAGNQSSAAAAALNTDDISIAREINQEDLALYRIAEEMFRTRYQLVMQGKRYVHGKVQQLSAQRLEGWAIDYSSKEPVQVDILLNGSVLTTKSSSCYVATMKERNIGREGYVGFIHSFSEPLSHDDTIEVRVRETGQKLRGPSRISKNTENNRDTAQIHSPATPANSNQPAPSLVRMQPLGKAANE